MATETSTSLLTGRIMTDDDDTPAPVVVPASLLAGDETAAAARAFEEEGEPVTSVTSQDDPINVLLKNSQSNDDMNHNKEQSPTTTTNANDDVDDDATMNHRPRWLRCFFGRCKKVPPKTGRDLGVWESSLEDQAGILSTWMLSYLTPFLRLGASKVLSDEDIGVPSQQDRADRAYERLRKTWDEQMLHTKQINQRLKQKHEAKLAACVTEEQRRKVTPLEEQLKEPSIAIALAKGFGIWKIVLALFYYTVSALLGFVPVLILNDLVKFFESGESTGKYYDTGNVLHNPWLEVAGLAVIPFLVAVLQARNQTIMAHCAVFVRTAVSTMLYQKSLRVSAAGRAKTSIGQVVNIMSNDTSQLQSFLQFASLTVVAPLQMTIALVLIYRQVGHATWVGIAYMIFLMPINVVIFSIASKQRREVLKYSDSRVKTMNEILAGIRVIKFYAWEQPFRLQVSSLRGKELEALTKLAYTSAIGFSLILLSAPLIQPILVFLTYVSIQSDPLSAAVAFTTIALFNIMRIPFAVLPMGFQQYIQSKIAVGRIERYLDFPELPDYVESSPPFAERGSPSIEEGGLVIQNGSFSWFDLEGKLIRPIQEDAKSKKRHTSLRQSAVALPDTDLAFSRHSISSCTSVETEGNLTGPAIALQDLNCSIEPGSLVAVVGGVGSGKSSFLSAILGEMEPVQGSKIQIPRPADCPAGYISYCSQTPWVVNDTLRGNILFGREWDEEHYNAVLEACALLDDLAILPAGDSTEIGERGINLSGGQKARVSLARALYSRDTRLVLMDDPLSAVDSHVGEHIFAKAIREPLAEGTTRILVTHHVHLLSRCDWIIVLDHGRIRHQGTYKDLVASGVDFAGAVDVSRAKTADEVDVTVQEEVKHVEKAKGLTDEKTADLMKKSGEKLVKDEEREKGSIAGSIYIHYGKVGGLQIVAMAFIVQGFGKASEVASGFWLSRWAKDTLEALTEGAPFSTTTTYRYLGIYALFGLLGVLGLTGRSLLMALHRMRSSKKLHKDLLESILRAPVSFFDVTPTGRILNRFAADMDRIDLQLMQTVSQAISAFFNILGALGAMVAATKGTFAIPLVPVAFIYYLIQRWFRKTYTELQRINSIANSPIFADFSQTLSGTSTIRAYGEETRFFDHCKYSFDSMNPSYILVQLTSNWLGLRLGVLGGLMGAFVAAIAVGTSSSGFVPAGWLGLALSYSIDVTNFLKLGAQTIATLEAQMNSVERVLYYTNSIESEAPEIIPDKDPSPGKWPMSGEIELQHASMRYRDGPLVLKDISLRVKGGEKVGVIGRTGSGKSSMMVLLFRISEIEKDGGKVVIDGVDTAEIGTATLRLNLSIIPQEPVIFSNTVRYNIDPFGNSNEEELWEVLKKIQMAEVVAALPGGLDAQVAEGGENFSQGQRQLLCIARSLLRNPKILVMDEATASIDNTTDNAIQAMIRKNFKDATVLTIAHRLNTIMDSDRVLVLERGRIAEYDTPEMLLKKKDGLFRSMVDKSRATKSAKIVEE